MYPNHGWQYRYKQCQTMLRKKGIRQSMGRKGNGLDNAVIESSFGPLKSELLYLQEFESMERFMSALIDFWTTTITVEAKQSERACCLHNAQTASPFG